MDDTPTDDLISKLKDVDPADSPDVADRIAQQLASELDEAAPIEVEEPGTATEVEPDAEAVEADADADADAGTDDAPDVGGEH